MQDFRKLTIWELSKELTLEVYRITSKFPNEEKFGMTSQIRRAASSVGANIAEGAGRGTNKDFANFINISIGSLAELENYIELAKDLNYIDNEQYLIILEKIDNTRRRCINFNKKLRS